MTATIKAAKKLAWEFAKILNQEARELEAAGVDIIQFDEPAFNVFFDEVNDWNNRMERGNRRGSNAKRPCIICYGYGIKANTDWKNTLGSEWRQYENRSPSCSSRISTSSRWNATTRVCPST